MNFRKGSVLILEYQTHRTIWSVRVVQSDNKAQMEAWIFNDIFVLALDLSLPVNSSSLSAVLEDLHAVVKRV